MADANRRPVMAGNWKMNKTVPEAVAFVNALAKSMTDLVADNLPEVVIAPPAVALTAVEEAIKQNNSPAHVAAHTMESKDNGAYTGETSPIMLKDLGVHWVIIGHSERRQYYNETDQTVNEKTKAALSHNLTPIVCVGETLAQREENDTDAVIRKQVKAALDGVDASAYPKLLFAYEPVWAIGTGKVCEPDEANRVCALIRQILNETGDGSQTRILYGGSVKPDNVQGLIAQSDIDGGLVGGASLAPDSFYQLITGSMLVNA